MWQSQATIPALGDHLGEENQMIIVTYVVRYTAGFGNWLPWRWDALWMQQPGGKSYLPGVLTEIKLGL